MAAKRNIRKEPQPPLSMSEMDALEVGDVVMVESRDGWSSKFPRQERTVVQKVSDTQVWVGLRDKPAHWRIFDKSSGRQYAAPAYPSKIVARIEAAEDEVA